MPVYIIIYVPGLATPAPSTPNGSPPLVVWWGCDIVVWWRGTMYEIYDKMQSIYHSQRKLGGRNFRSYGQIE